MSEMEVSKSASQLLVEAREEAGLSQKEVADQLFLSSRVITQIDDEAFDRFPKTAFIKGYLRSYARIVGLSGEEVVARYEEALREQRAKEEETEVEEKKKEPDSNQKIVRASMFGFGALVVIIAIIWIFSGDRDTDKETTRPFEEPPAIDIASIDRQPARSDATIDEQQPRQPDTTLLASDTINTGIDSIADTDASKAGEVLEEEQAATEPDSQDAEQPGIVDSELEEAIVESEAAPEVQSMPSVQSDAQRMKALKEVALQRTRERDVQYIIVRAGGDEELNFEFDDECWVEILDGEGDLIYKELNRKGDVLKVYGIKPFDILFGKADVVTLQFNGVAVAIDARIRNDDTARVRLGG